MTQIIKFHASSAAFATGRLVHTTYNTGCTRNILLKHHNVREPFKQQTADVGALNEDLFEKELKEKGETYDREVEIKREHDFYPNTHVSMRMDFKIGSTVHELKSTQSKNKLAALKKGEGFTHENLAQLVTYVLETESSEGRLTYTFYGEPLGRRSKGAVSAFGPQLTRSFLVTLSEDGRICVDSKPTQFTVSHLYAHQALVFESISQHVVLDRPANYANNFGSPCAYCPFAKACEAYEKEELTTDGFISRATACITPKP